MRRQAAGGGRYRAMKRGVGGAAEAAGLSSGEPDEEFHF